MSLVFLVITAITTKHINYLFSSSSLTSSHPLELIYSDIWTCPIVSYDGYKHYVIFFDHHTHYIWFYCLKKKSDIHEIFIRFKAFVEKIFKRSIIIFYTNNGGEYISLKYFLATNGISHLTTPPHTPKHNSFSEHCHRHIVVTELTLLHNAHIPLNFWPYAFTTAAHLINHMPKVNLSMTSSFEKLFGHEPNYHKLRVFDCLYYIWFRPYRSNKLDPRSQPCVVLGYSSTQSAYQSYDPNSKKIFISHHVTFVESTLLGNNSGKSHNQSVRNGIDL